MEEKKIEGEIIAWWSKFFFMDIFCEKKKKNTQAPRDQMIDFSVEKSLILLEWIMISNVYWSSNV